MTTKIAVFASGSGSNYQAIQEAIEKGELDAQVVLVVTDRPGAYVTTRAQSFHVPVLEIAPKQFESKAQYEQAIVEALQSNEVEWVVLAGYMRLVGEVLLHAYANKIVNIHPSLLPSFPGKDAIGQAFEAGVKVTGVTVHYVDAGMDTGPIIAQAAIDVVENDLQATEARIHAVEHVLYKQTLQRLFKQSVSN
jgi:phosphoribosylglycinamide formyltransferase 1